MNNPDSNPFPEIPDAALRQIWGRASTEFVYMKLVLVRTASYKDTDDAVRLLCHTHAEMKARGMEVDG